jgi:formate hydrogenlyase subunit 3/multisubunit Na+/H+ antiporter MnhD subunit
MSVALAVLFFVVPFLPVAIAPWLLMDRAHKLLPLVPWVPATGLLLLPFQGELIELPWLLLGARLGIDDSALPLLLLAIIGWTIAGWHARRHLPELDQGRFFFFWLLTWCGNFCVFITLDGASFYAAYAMMTFSAYGLVVHLRRPEDYRAGRVYLTMAVIGEACLLAALLLLAVEYGNPRLEIGPSLVASSARAHTITLLMLAAFGVKMGMVGLHMWLPLAHPQAPVPASAVLSGVILKAGLMGWLRFLPLGEPGFESIGLLLLVAGLTSAFYGATIGLTQPRIKSLLAYSSISQMGLVAAIVALAMLHPMEAPLYVWLATLFALHHGLAKSTLFLGADLVRSSPALARALLWIPAAALAGLPLTSGALAKAAWKGSLPLELSAVSPWLMASSVLSTILMARFLMLAWPTGSTAQQTSTAHAAWPWLAMLMTSLTVPWGYAVIVAPDMALVAFRPAYLLETLGPVVAGVLVVGLAARFLRRPLPAVPEGDVLALLPRPPRLVRLPPLQAPQLRWQPPLASLERAFSRLAPAFIAGALLIGAAILLLGR